MEMPGWWLVVECSGRAARLAVAEGGELRAEAELPESRRHARDLAATAARLFAEQGVALRDAGGVLAARGPGSFTGLRVGLVSAQTLAYATGCALVLADTFAAVAARTPDALSRVDVISDGLQAHVYVQSWERSPAGWGPVAPLSIRPIASWLAGRHPDAAATGPGVSACAALLPAELPRVPPEWRDPTPAGLLLAARAGLAGVSQVGWLEAEPLYLRGSSAEEKLKRESGG